MGLWAPAVWGLVVAGVVCGTAACDSKGSNAPRATRPRSSDSGSSPAAADEHSVIAGTQAGHAVAVASRRASALANDMTASEQKPVATSATPVSLVLPLVSKAALVGTLAGPGATQAASGTYPYGTDLGLSYEHDGELFLLFGDTWPYANFTCVNPRPTNDETLAKLPTSYPGGIPPLEFLTDLGAPDGFSTLQLVRQSESLPLGFGQVPMTAFSDGDHVFAVFARLEPTRCNPASALVAAACPSHDGFACSTTLGECTPSYGIPVPCDLATRLGCLAGQTCAPSPTPLCLDPTSSQYDGSYDGESSAVAQNTELARQREATPEIYDSVFTLPTNKFANVTARSITSFSGQQQGSDYAPGHGALLIWGRPGFAGEHGREAQLYLMTHPLPLALDAKGTLQFTPQYFAGVDPGTGEPKWSSLQSDAQPLALDGKPSGDPHEDQQIVNQTAISWLGAPIDKWVMLYGGDVSDYVLIDPASARTRAAPGSIMIRFADQPWGPWSAPKVHLAPGEPTKIGDPYGPGGFLYHVDCQDQLPDLCARTDPTRPTDSLLRSCVSSNPQPDIGRLYGVNIIDSYIAPNPAGGLDLFWNVSTWNPYAVVLMKTSIQAPVAAKPGLELANTSALARLSDWRSLPVLGESGRYVQQSSHDRGTDDDAYPLSRNGNRDFNNFICASSDATLSTQQNAPFKLDKAACDETYVRGAELARFEGGGRLVRTWIASSSLLLAPADDEILRIYVDDDPQPRVEVPLAEALNGEADDVFAPPFGIGSSRRFAWYYPLVFNQKLIVALDHLGDFDDYFYQCDAVLDRAPASNTSVDELPPDREAARAQLNALYHPVSAAKSFGTAEAIALDAGAVRSLRFSGPATIHEVKVRVPDSALSSLKAVDVRVRWNAGAQSPIDLPLLALFAADATPPGHASQALASFVESNGERVLALHLPMPFETEAEWTFSNHGDGAVKFELELLGEQRLPPSPFGHLHVQRRETVGPTTATYHVAAQASGRGRLVGVCAHLEGHADPDSSFQSEALNLLEGDSTATLDGETALVGTGTEDYADDVFYFADTAQTSPFSQAWGVDDGSNGPTGVANFCHWHVLGTELDFLSSLEMKFELGGMRNPSVVDRYRTVAFLYLTDQ